MIGTLPLMGDVLRLRAPEGYLPDVPLLVRIEIEQPDGRYRLDPWDAEIQLHVDDPNISLSTNRVVLRNGMGSETVSVSGDTDFRLTASWQGLSDSTTLTNFTAYPRTTVQGPVSGPEESWSGIVEVVGDVVVPSGSTLTLAPGTLVLIQPGEPGGPGISLSIEGALRTEGNADSPVTITSAVAGSRWGQIRHQPGSSGNYEHTTISFGGNAPGEGHTGTGPVFRVEDSMVTLRDCSITDLADASGGPGKVMMAYGSELGIERTLMTRARMGPEIASSSLVCSDSYFLDFRGPDDADALYVHTQQPGQEVLLQRCVFARGDDDGIDTAGAEIRIQDCIIRDWLNPDEDAKGVSLFHGNATLEGCLIAHCYWGVGAKSSGPLTRVVIDRTTVFGGLRGLSAAYKANATAGNIQYEVSNSIVVSDEPLHSDFGVERFDVSYSTLNNPWAGVGVGIQFANPLFLNPGKDFHLRPVSPAIDAGDPVANPDPDGTVVDQGAFAFRQDGVRPSTPGVVISEIMFHPSSEDVREEFIELHNTGTNTVDLSGWQITQGVNFLLPTNTTLSADGYLVIAADPDVFLNKYPGAGAVLGGWDGILSNRGESIELEDNLGNRVDRVQYADEGDWAMRERGPLDRGHRGWRWNSPADGLGFSLELIQPYMPNGNGQNWASSVVAEGTPGLPNSVASHDLPPMIRDVRQYPIVPRSTDPVLVTAEVVDEYLADVELFLHYRVDQLEPLPFETLTAQDDGLHEDGIAGDGVYGATLPAFPDNTVVEFFLRAVDANGQVRFWPAPAQLTDGRFAHSANALYQVDDVVYESRQPLLKIVMREEERAELAQIGSTSTESRSDAQMNASFVSVDGTGTEQRYLVGVRNRGHGTRTGKPNNHRVNFRSDATWKGVEAININARYTHLQHFGSVIALRSGLAGAQARPIQLRVNNENLGNNGPQTYGTTYVMNEVVNGDWANLRFPEDSSGNVYRALRDIAPSDFSYRGEDSDSYRNTWFKNTNTSEDDWSDLIGMLRIVGTNDLYSAGAVRQVIDVEQWLLYLAVVALFDNRETSPNRGYNDDYMMYSGALDRRFRMLYYDLDTILGEGDSRGSPDATLFGSTTMPAFERLLSDPELLPIYYRTLQRLIDTTFSAEQFDPLLEETLADYVPADVLVRMKNWMAARRDYVRSQIPSDLPPEPILPRAVLTGAPRSPTPRSEATLHVSGAGLSHYRYRLNGGDFGAEQAVGMPIELSTLPTGTNVLEVIGRTAEEIWQPEADASVARWVVDPGWPSVRLNEVLAVNNSAEPHEGRFPDLIELFNEGDAPVDLSGLRLTDNLTKPNKFVFPAGTILGAGAYLVIVADSAGSSSLLHADFSLSQDGESLYLLDRISAGDIQLDSCVFGIQAADLSLGRFEDGDWRVTVPSFGAANTPAGLGDPGRLKINEWLALGRVLFNDDFVELYNPDTLPVLLDGLSLTDNISVAWDRHRIAPLSVIAAGGFVSFLADEEIHKGAHHLNFRLAAEGGEIGLFDGEGNLIDAVMYGAQWPDLSEGRHPDGASRLRGLTRATPGTPNFYLAPTVRTETVDLLDWQHVWRYNQTEDLTGLPWVEAGFDDSSWPEGPGLLGDDSTSPPVPFLTLLDLGRVTYYFRTTFEYTPTGAGTNLWLSTLIDDGAIIYLNGQEVYRSRMPDVESPAYDVLASSSVNNVAIEGPAVISLDALQPGANVFAVEVHQSSLSSGDVSLGLKLQVVELIDDSSLFPLQLNEVMASSRLTTHLDGRQSDWVEILNTGTEEMDLSDMSLTDDLADPRKFVFAVGTVLPAGSYLVISCDSAALPSVDNTGFGLRETGEEVFLFNRPSDGGEMMDSITYGLQIADYSLGRVGAMGSPWRLSLPTPGSENIPAVLGDAVHLVVNEWMAQPQSGDDWLELHNPEEQPVEISGLSLSDDLLSPTQSPIAPLSFIGAGDDGYALFVADGDVGAGADHLSFRLGAGGDEIGIWDPDSGWIDSIAFGPQEAGVAQGRWPDGSAEVRSFPATPSPGEVNYLWLTNLVINEVLSHTDPPLEDAVEFFNPGSEPVDISGWYLSNTSRETRKVRVPDGTVVPAGGYAVLYEQQFGPETQPNGFSFNSAHGDSVWLSSIDNEGQLTGLRTGIEFGAAANGISFGTHATSQGMDFVPLSEPTFGVGQPASLEQFREGTGAPNASALRSVVVVNEVMFQPPAADATDNTLDEYIELHNPTAFAVPLFDPNAVTNAWRLRGGVDFDLPTGLTLPAGGYLVLVSFDPDLFPGVQESFRTRYGVPAEVPVLGPYSGTLSNTGESVRLQRPDPPQRPPSPDAGFVPYTWAEGFLYSSVAPWPVDAAGTGQSLQRINGQLYANDPLHWTSAEPSPGRPNSLAPVDSDLDGLPDDWELFHFRTLDRDGLGDFDQDGLSDGGEFQVRTDPTQAGSVLKVNWDLDSLPDQVVVIDARAGVTYSLEYTDAVDSAGWEKWVDLGPLQESQQVPVMVETPAGGSRFFRLVSPATP